jgi:membrane associated rhomboid family serine protease
MFPLKDDIALARFPLLTACLIVVNVVVYLLEIRHGGHFFSGPEDSVTVRWGAIPYEFTHPGDHCGLATAASARATRVVCQGQAGVVASPGSQPPTWATAFSSMFMHASFLHVLGNMLFLGIFGPSVEDRLGRLRYLLFYLLGGLVALAAEVLAGPDSTSPMIGASGAIAAVLGGYILMYPRARVITVVFIPFFVSLVEVPAVYLVGCWFVLQLLYALAGLATPLGGAPGVAYFAQVVGFLFGLLVIRLLVVRHPRRRFGV